MSFSSIGLSPFTVRLNGFRLTQSLVLENLSHRFSKPNILDIKLGTVLYDETASEDKVARMIKAAKDTTSFETGVRLTGFQASLDLPNCVLTKHSDNACPHVQ